MLEKSAETQTRESVKSVESIFSYIKREKIRDKLVVVSAENPFGALGYEVCDVKDERGQKVLSEINRYYDEEIIKVSALSISSVFPECAAVIGRRLSESELRGLREIPPDVNTLNFFLDRLKKAEQRYVKTLPDAHMRDENRRQIDRPDFVPIKKGERYYVGVRYDRAMLVLEPPPPQFFITNHILSGLRMKHFLLSSRNKQKYLDIISVHPDIDSYPVFFSFSSIDCPNIVYPRIYSLKDSDGTETLLTFLGMIYMNFRAISLPGWVVDRNEEHAAFELLHEFGHLLDDMRRAFSDQSFHLTQLERNAHAFALFIASKINRKYPDEGFFDLKALRDIAQKFLTTYDPALRRGEARKMVIDLESRSMKPNLFVETVKILLEVVESFLRQVPSLRR